MAVVANVLSQHVEEAAMLWILGRAASKAPHYSLIDLAKLDARVEAHLDGLRIAGDEGWEVCEAQLAANEAGEVFAASIPAYESGNPERIAKVMSVVKKEPGLGVGLASALGWHSLKQAEPHILALLRSSDPLRQQLGLAAAAMHRWSPGDVLGQSVRANDPALRARALRAAGELHDRTLSRAVGDALSDADPECQFAAAWSGALLGLPEATPILQQIAESVPSRSTAAAAMAVRRLELPAALSWQKRLATNSKLLRTAMVVAGAIGDPASVPWLISLMDQLPLARLAGQSFTMIVGIGLAYRDLERKPPEDFHAGPTEDPNDENVEMDPDDNLPWPEPKLVANWWQKNQGQFQSGTRYLCGRPMTIEWLKEVLRDGYQRQRAAAALELAIRQPGSPLFNVKAPGFRQIQLLGKPGAPIR
jgi:uncharacterized protein (TIGR02270 family)